jgi:hypothetical protein
MDDLQAPIPTDHNCRRRAFLILGALYGAALLADTLAANWDLIAS